MSNFDPNNPDLTVHAHIDRKDQLFNISVAARNLHDMTAKQADIYLKGLIAQALKNAVMQHYPAILRLVDEAIHADGMREQIEKVVLEEVAKRAKQSIDDMFG